MLRRLVAYSLPMADAASQARVYRTIIGQTDPSPYATIDEILDRQESLELKIEQILEPLPIEEILCIHNASGMRDLAQMQSMITKIKNGGLVMNSNGLPNIKVVLAPGKKWLMFDGHHTALAYLLAGKRYLHETPYISMSNAGIPFGAQEISYFFPEDFRARVKEDWFKYTVNWQSPKDKAELRVQKTLGDLLSIIKNT
ncbi:MAG TPA: hypothetical protein VMQ44_00450 [Candidatus Saccharimonadales bacterium]|nr:hypothetical protein [Candidatus Saccharimonadales bacterium]